MSRAYFGTDGIRGRVGQEPITADFALRLGAAVGQVNGKGLGAVLVNFLDVDEFVGSEDCEIFG